MDTKHIWIKAQKILNLGQGAVLDIAEARKLRQVNAGALFAWFSVAFFALFYLTLGPKAWLPLIINLVVLFLLPLVWWLNSKEKLVWGRLLLVFIADALILTQYALVQGSQYKIHYYFGALACVPVVLFPWREYVWIWFFSILNIVLFAWCDQGLWLGAATGLNQEYTGHLFLSMANAIGAVGVAVFTLIYSEYAAYNSEKLILAERDRARTETMVDSLTRIGNRRKFDKSLEQEFARIQRMQGQCVLMMCDVDYFKKYNDLYGHPMGDQILQKVASILKQSLHRRTDILCRFGGEEFALILPAMDHQAACKFAEYLCEHIYSQNIAHAEGIDGRLTLSLGIALADPRLHSHSSDWLYAADQALYRAKAQGRNGWQASDLSES